MKKMVGKKETSSKFHVFSHGSKRGQVTIFIILAILIVSMIAILYWNGFPGLNFQTSDRLFVESCIENSLEPYIKELALTAGLQNPKFTYQYLGENITFVCYSDEYYKPCVVQQAFLKTTFENSLRRIADEKIRECYDNGVEELQAKGYEVTQGQIDYLLEINPSGISVLIDAPTTVSSGDSSSMTRKINVQINSEIYKVLMIANSVVQFETIYGDSDISTFMLYYPELNLQKIRAEEGVKIYIISDKEDIEYKFASRSYAWPPGYGLEN